MERILKLLDNLDDFGAFLHVHGRSVIVTALLLVAFLAAVAGVFVLGPPDLLAAP
jgi:hypothetical protein